MGNPLIPQTWGIKQPFLCSWILWVRSSDRTWQECLVSVPWCPRPQLEDSDFTGDALASWAWSPGGIVTCMSHGWDWLLAEPHSGQFLPISVTSSCVLVFLTAWWFQGNQTSYVVCSSGLQRTMSSLEGRSCTGFCNLHLGVTWQ